MKKPCSTDVVVVLVTAMAAGIATLGGCKKKIAQSGPPAVTTVILRPESVTQVLRFSGTVRPKQTVELSFKVPGKVASLYQVKSADGTRDVQEGDLLESGTVIAELDKADLRRAADLAVARREQAEQNVKRAQAGLGLAKNEFERVKSLFEKDAAAKSEFDNSNSRLAMAIAELAGGEKESLAARLTAEEAAARLEDCTLHIPLKSATVSGKYVEGGENVPAGARAFQVMDVSEVRLAFGVPDTMVGGTLAGAKVSQVALGQKLRLTADAFEGTIFEGEVVKIAPSADPNSRTFLTEVKIDNKDRRLKPGMIMTISIRQDVAGADDGKGLLLLPMAAIQAAGEGEPAAAPTTRAAQAPSGSVFVAVDENGVTVARRRMVRLGGVYDNRVHIKPGSEIKAGDPVIVGGAWRLADGQIVSVIPQSSAPQQP